MSTRSSEPHFWLTQHKFPRHKCSSEFPPWKEQSVSLSSFLTKSSETFLVKNTLLGHLVHKLTHIRALPVAYSPHMLPELGWLNYRDSTLSSGTLSQFNIPYCQYLLSAIDIFLHFSSWLFALLSWHLHYDLYFFIVLS